MKIIKDQPLFSTLPDSQGERRDKQFLIDVVTGMPPRFPLGQHHDAALPYVGYIENFRLEEMPDMPSEWRIIGDVYIETDGEFPAFGGFSFSKTEILKRSADGLGALFIPYPFYRDEKLIDELMSYDPQLDAGQWIKKNADPKTLTLLVSFVVFVLNPVWKKLFDEKVWPFVERVYQSYKKGRLSDTPFDYGAMIQGRNGETINVYFVPDRKNLEATFTKVLIEDGLRKVIEFISKDDKGARIGISLIKLHFHNTTEGYRITSVQYSDGKLLHEI